MCAVVDEVGGDKGHCSDRDWEMKDALERSEVPTGKWRLGFPSGFPVIRDILEMRANYFSIA